MKNNDLSSIESLIFTTEEVITYFNNKITEYNSLDNLNLDEIEAKNHSKNNIDFSLISSEIEEFISRKIDVLKKNKKYLGTDILRYLHFALIALIDEMMITQYWPGQSYWSSHSLESKVFFSSSAGDLFFENCDAILLNRDYKTRELAFCYFLCLCAGFKGRFHSNYDIDKIEQIKINLYQFYLDSNSDRSQSTSLGLLPRIGYEPRENNFDVKNKKINYFLLLLNLFLFTIFLAFSIYIWISNKSILTKIIQ